MQLQDNERLTTKPGSEADWEKCVKANQDPYGHAVIEAASLVGKALDEGRTPEEAMKACYGLGITGFMAGCMASMIAQLHPRGDEFRRHWNIKHQIRDEGERANEKPNAVLNPAILTTGNQP